VPIWQAAAVYCDLLLPGLLNLHDDLRLNIFSYLNNSELQLVGHTSHQLYFIAHDYLTRHRHNTGLVTLPNELILEIV
jgi:hypothetical protein